MSERRGFELPMPGDHVVLASGGPLLTVSAVQVHKDGSEPPTVYVHWAADAGDVREGSFPLPCLRRLVPFVEGS